LKIHQTLHVKHCTECDKNFLAYWFHKRIFPNVTNVFIDSHPCDYYVLNRNFGNIYLHEKYIRYKQLWWSSSTNVKMISEEEYQFNLTKYKNEDILFLSNLNISE
jgi:hypothetical protein